MNKIFTLKEWNHYAVTGKVTEIDLHTNGDKNYIAISCDECGSKVYDCRKKGDFKKIECDNCDWFGFRLIAKEK